MPNSRCYARAALAGSFLPGNHDWAWGGWRRLGCRAATGSLRRIASRWVRFLSPPRWLSRPGSRGPGGVAPPRLRSTRSGGSATVRSQGNVPHPEVDIERLPFGHCHNEVGVGLPALARSPDRDGLAAPRASLAVVTIPRMRNLRTFPSLANPDVRARPARHPGVDDPVSWVAETEGLPPTNRPPFHPQRG